jgi:hypothetical protein
VFDNIVTLVMMPENYDRAAPTLAVHIRSARRSLRPGIDR